MNNQDRADNNIVAHFNAYGKDITLHGVAEDDWIFKSIERTRNFYEVDLLKYIRHALRWKSGAVIDIGANIGNHSVFFGQFVANTVLCFEPNPKVLPILRRNLSENHISFKLFECGLGETTTLGNISIPDGPDTNIGAAKIVLSDNSSEAVQVVPLDSLLPEINSYLEGDSIIAMKIDVEGMEPEVIRGARTLIERHLPELFVEITDNHQMIRIESILSEMGYHKVIAYAATPVWHFAHSSRSLFYFLWLKIHPLSQSIAKYIRTRLSRILNRQEPLKS